MSLAVLQHGGWSGNSGTITVTYAADADEVDLFVAAGSPSAAVKVRMVVEDGVVIGSTSTGTAALDTGTGWHASATLECLLHGSARIQAAGGAGGDGGEVPAGKFDPGANGGGGGGGQGEDGGAGGSGPGSASDGSAGLRNDKGDGGLGGVASSNTSSPTNGSAGGDAVNLQKDITFFTSGAGNVWGGGGGGGGGSANTGTGGDGGLAGDAGQSPSGGGTGGPAGKAVELNGNSVTWDGGIGAFDVRGAVS